MRKEAASTKGTWIKEIRVGTVEPRDNKGTRDWYSLFAIPGSLYRGSFTYILLLLGFKKLFVISRTSFHRGSIRYIEVPL